jgi:hypothetical protein
MLIDLGEAALPLVHVVGDVGHEVGVGAVGLAHHAVLVVAVVGGAQPQRAASSKVLPAATSAARSLDAAARVQAGLEEVVVEAHAEGLQVQVLLVAQVGHRELADAVEVVASPEAVNSRSSALTVFFARKSAAMSAMYSPL